MNEADNQFITGEIIHSATAVDWVSLVGDVFLCMSPEPVDNALILPYPEGQHSACDVLIYNSTRIGHG